MITTSNSAPDDLYKRGLQRQLFLPAIEMLKQHTNVMHVPTRMDYRLGHLKHAGVFYRTQDELTHQNMEKSFNILVENATQHIEPILICDRLIPIKKQAADVVWFDFTVICNVPRSQHDYLAIAEKYKTVLISNIPIIPPEARNTISLFIKLVDVFYDKHIRLVFSAADTVDKIYTSGEMISDYQRTCSRLQEMQSEDYFAGSL